MKKEIGTMTHLQNKINALQFDDVPKAINIVTNFEIPEKQVSQTPEKTKTPQRIYVGDEER